MFAKTGYAYPNKHGTFATTIYTQGQQRIGEIIVETLFVIYTVQCLTQLQLVLYL